MIPILFSENATSFTTNGIGRLSDANKCIVKEERNGAYELEMEYPVTGAHYSEITVSKIIHAVPADGKYAQPFRIYKTEKLISGRIRVYAEHITYQANHIPVMPFEANSAASAMAQLQSNAVGPNPFTLWTDLQTTGHYVQEEPESIRARLGGQEGSILDLYGGEYEWDNYTIKLHQNRGQDRGVVLRYGKNLTDLSQENNITTTYTAVCPYVKESEDDPLITLPEKYIAASNAGNYPYLRIKIIDFTKEFDDDEEITVAALRQKTNEYIAANNIGIPKISIKVSFVALWQTEEYKNIAPLERVNLCDTVTVKFEKLGVEAKAKVIKTEYNVLLDRYNSIEIGEAKSTISATVATQEQKIVTEVDSDLLRAQKHATELITGGLGGYVVLKRNANGKPEELLIMDKENIEEAVHVWRYNKNGWGYSSTGYNGLYTLAATLDGGFVADFITTGTLNANLVKAGMLSDKAGANYWDMVTGDFQLSPGASVRGAALANTSDVATGDANTLSQANSAADSKISAFDAALNQQKVFNKLTNNGQLQGIYMRNGRLYINASYIASGVIADTSGNTLWDLSTGALSSKKFSIDSTFFKLEESGKITSITDDGKKLVFEKGTITGFRANGTQSAKLEIGDDLFNIVGKLALNGVVGVSGSTSFVKGIDYEEASLGNVCTALWTENFTYAYDFSMPTITASASGNITVSGMVGGQYTTMSGYVSLPVNISVTGGRVYTKTGTCFGAAGPTFNTIKYAKAISASTGAINSSDGLIQSIS
ncbi:MAG: phage tail protein [Spirochaetia bacterium]|nr:phage tail protein [Spirochaetia bacterium]